MYHRQEAQHGGDESCLKSIDLHRGEAIRFVLTVRGTGFDE